MRAVRFTARAPLFRVIPDLEFRSGQWTAVQIDELSQEQLEGLVTYHGSHLGIHPDDADALAEHGLEVDGRNKLVLAGVEPIVVPPLAAPVEPPATAPIDPDQHDDEDGTPPTPPRKGGRKRG